MSTIEHPIGPTALAIKAALDDILAKAKEKRDVSFYLDSKGRLPFRNILPLLQSMAMTADSPNGVKGGLCGYIPWNEQYDNTIQRRKLIISESVTEIADNFRLGYKYNLAGAPFPSIFLVGYLHLPNCVRIGAHALEPIDRSVCVYMGTSQDSFSQLEEIGEEALHNVVAHIDLDFPKLRTIGYWAMHFNNLPTKRIRATWSFPAIQTIGRYAFSGLNMNINDEDTVVTLRFPNLAANTVRTMANFPFGLETGSVIVCKDNEGVIVQ